jgi:hypothetical protein
MANEFITRNGLISLSNATVTGSLNVSGNSSITGLLNLIGNQIITGSSTATGGYTGSIFGTASYASNALSSSYATLTQTANTSSYVNTLNQNVSITGSISTTGNISASSLTGSLQGTSSYALQALSASYSTTASYALNVPVTASYAITSSYTVSASQAQNANNAITASYVLNAVSASQAQNANTASYVLNAVSASQAQNANTASYVLNAVSASQAQNAITASYVLNAVSASQAQNAITASYVLNAVSASYATSSSYAQTASFANNFTVAGTLTATGAIIANNSNNPQIQGNGTTLNIAPTNSWNNGISALISLGLADLNMWSNAGRFLFNNSAGTPIMTLVSTSGNLLIGTTTDNGNKLQVNGNATVSGTITANTIVKTGGTSSQFLKADGSVDNTVYAPLASPSLTGVPTAPTAAPGTNTTQLATTAFVQSALPVGGPFLPLTGGSLTGNLSMTGNTLYASRFVIPGSGQIANSPNAYLTQYTASANIIQTAYTNNIYNDPVNGLVRDNSTYGANRLIMNTSNVNELVGMSYSMYNNSGTQVLSFGANIDASGTYTNGYLAGRWNFGSYKQSPDAIMDIDGGSSTIPSIILKNSSALYAGTKSGAFQRFNDRLYFTQASGTQQTVAYLSDVNNIGVIGNTYTTNAAGTSTFTVPIGTTMANAFYFVVVTPGNSLSAALFYVTNKTTTTFDVVYLTGLRGSVKFDWILSPNNY